MQDVLDEMEDGVAYHPVNLVKLTQHITGYQRGVAISLLKDMETTGLLLKRADHLRLIKNKQVGPQKLL